MGFSHVVSRLPDVFPSGRRVVGGVLLHEQITKNLKYDRNMTEISVSAGKTLGEYKQWTKVTLTAEILKSSSRENKTRTSRGVLSRVVLEINTRSSSRETKSLMAANSSKWKAFHVNNI